MNKIIEKLNTIMVMAKLLGYTCFDCSKISSDKSDAMICYIFQNSKMIFAFTLDVDQNHINSCKLEFGETSNETRTISHQNNPSLEEVFLLSDKLANLL